MKLDRDGDGVACER
ncbi:excalibur calcium-binding domain-containing protein [Paenibacillus terrae]